MAVPGKFIQVSVSRFGDNIRHVSFRSKKIPYLDSMLHFCNVLPNILGCCYGLATFRNATGNFGFDRDFRSFERVIVICDFLPPTRFSAIAVCTNVRCATHSKLLPASKGSDFGFETHPIATAASVQDRFFLLENILL